MGQGEGVMCVSVHMCECMCVHKHVYVLGEEGECDVCACV